MTKPRILRITRPYESVDDYIESEGWTISTKRMILLDQPRLDRDTIVRFELSLQNGDKLIRAEARVVGYQAPTPDKPGGPKVRFKRFGGTTKAFIQQVVSEHGPGPGLETMHPSGELGSDAQASASPMSLRHPEAKETAPSSGRASQPARLKLETLELEGVPASAPGTPLSRPQGSRDHLQRLLERAGAGPVPAPKDRDDLLDRLRARARQLPSAHQAEHPSSGEGARAG